MAVLQQATGHDGLDPADLLEVQSVQLSSCLDKSLGIRSGRCGQRLLQGTGHPYRERHACKIT
jgi:hypothetical protein